MGYLLSEKPGEKFVVGETNRQVQILLSEKPTGKYRFYINSIKAEADTGNGDDKVRPSY